MESATEPDPGARLKALMRAPERSHEDWPKVIHSLRQLLPILERLVEDDFELEWLVRAVTILTGNHGPIDPAGLGLSPKHGYITRSPIFAALAAQPHDGVRSDLVRATQSFLLVAAAMRESYVLGDEVHPPVETAGLSVRKIATYGLSDRPARGIRNAGSVRELCGLFESWLNAKAIQFATEFGESGARRDESIVLTGAERKIVGPLSTFLHDARDQRPRRYRIPVETREPRTRITTRIESAGSESGQRGSERSSAIIEFGLDDVAQKERRNEGLCPNDEFASRIAFAEYASSRDPRFPADRMTENQANRRIRLKARGYKTTQQWTPNRTEVLHLPALQALLASEKPEDAKSIVRWEMLALMLLTGCTVGDIQKFRVWEHPLGPYETPDCLGIFAETGKLIVPVYDLPQSWQPEKALASYFDRPDRKLEKHYRRPWRLIVIDFPSYFAVGEQLLDRAIRQGSGRLFPGLKKGDLDRASAALGEHVNALNKKHHCNMTLTRISRHLANSIYALDGDLAEAFLLSHQHKADNDPRLYYYAPSCGHLAQQYDRVWSSLDRIVNGSLEDRSEDSHFDESHVGSSAVPLTSRIRSDVARLFNRVEGHMTIKGRRPRGTWWLVHNILTAYVIRQIQWMTGIRAVRDPIELQNYDPNTGFLRINDKDTADNYGARVVWLLPSVQRQVQSYLQQVGLAAKAWSMGFGDLAFRFFERDGQPLDASLSTLERFTACAYPYAPNAHRHYQRTRLRELGVDAGYVDAWLGHGGMGREPYARHSAITPQAVRLAVAPALETIWEELGWQVLPNKH